MLAVEVVFAGADPVPTFVFDEVDAGVGGRAAVEVGARLARLARSAQVVVVTHLPQVAAFADAHLVVTKSSDGSVTRSGVTTLDEAGREHELSRMLAGLSGSESARAHAAELLETAAQTKAEQIHLRRPRAGVGPEAVARRVAPWQDNEAPHPAAVTTRRAAGRRRHRPPRPAHQEPDQAARTW